MMSNANLLENEFSFSYSPPQLVCMVRISTKLAFNMIHKIVKTLKDIRS